MFKSISYFLIGRINNKVEELLQSNGGKRCQYLTDKVSHCIIEDLTDSKNLEECNEAIELYQKPIVTISWITESTECGHLLSHELFIFEQKRIIFLNMIIYVTNVCKDDRTLLWYLITSHGGIFANKPNENVTHIVTTKYKEILCEAASRDGVLVVTPDWIMDSISDLVIRDATEYHPSQLLNLLENLMTKDNKTQIMSNQSDDEAIEINKDEIEQLIDSKDRCTIKRLHVSAQRIKEDFISSVDDVSSNCVNAMPIMTDMISVEKEPQHHIKVKVKYSHNAHTIPKVLPQNDSSRKRVPKVSVKNPPIPRIVFSGSKPEDTSKNMASSKKKKVPTATLR